MKGARTLAIAGIVTAGAVGLGTGRAGAQVIVSGGTTTVAPAWGVPVAPAPMFVAPAPVVVTRAPVVISPAWGYRTAVPVVQPMPFATGGYVTRRTWAGGPGWGGPGWGSPGWGRPGWGGPGWGRPGWGGPGWGGPRSSWGFGFNVVR